MDESARVMYSSDQGQETYGPRDFTWEAWKEGAIAEENQVLKIYHWYAARQEPKMVDSGVILGYCESILSLLYFPCS